MSAAKRRGLGARDLDVLLGVPESEATESEGAYRLLKLASLQPGKYQPRKAFAQEPLDELVASPTKFAGGYKEARREFSLEALMFAIIEQYPGDVRWKRSAAVARDALARMAANAKVSSPQAYKEAKQRVDDLAELLNGNNLDGTPNSELVWSDVIDRVPLMQLLDWAQQQHINTYSSSPENFKEHKEELQRFAEFLQLRGRS